ncbi:hypothetical protein [Celeribacter sp.]|uniref:hypothetical protein n=1 Tax=Celeribacter sp. TaxID=1890673 RepID=UPI003A941B4D
MQHIFSVIATVLAFGLTLVTVVSGPVRGETPTLAIIPPWEDADQMLARVGLTRIGPLRAPFGTLVDTRSEADLIALSHAGVWFVLDGSKIAQLCGIENV